MYRNIILSALIVGPLLVLSWFLRAKPATSTASGDKKDEQAPGKLEPIWESSAGIHGKELIQSFSADGKQAFFFHTVTKDIVARDTTTWHRTGQVQANAKLMTALEGEKVVAPNGTVGAYSQPLYVEGVAKSSRIVFFDPKTDRPLATADAHPVYTQPVLAFSPDGKMLASSSTDGSILWDAQTYRKRLFLKDQENHRPTGMVFTPDGRMLAVNSWGQVVFWDTGNGERKFALGGHIAQVWNVAISPDGKQLASVGNDPQLIFWNPETGINVGKIPLDTAHLQAPICFSPNGKLLAVGDKSLVRIFDPHSRQLLLELQGHTSNVQVLAFRPDGKQLASGSGGVRWVNDQPHADRGETILWDIAGARVQHLMRSHGFGVHSLAYSPDGKALISGGGTSVPSLIVNLSEGEHVHGIGMWKSDTGEFIKWLPVAKGHAVTALAFRPDGKVIAHNAVDGSQIQLLDAATGKEIRKLQLMNTASAFTFSKDGKRLAAVGAAGGLDSGKGFIQVLDPNSGNTVARRVAHSQDINCVVFASDGRTLVTGGSDSAIWKWKLSE